MAHSTTALHNLARLSLTLGLLALAGCEHDGFMDPRQVGRWEHTPTSVPVLERLACVEGPGVPGMDAGVGIGGVTNITQADLIPEVDVYRMGAGDVIEVRIVDLYSPDREEKFERSVDPRGHIDLPKLGSIFVEGQSADEVQQTVARAYKIKKVLNDPIVDVNVTQRRRLTYNLVGGMNAPGTYGVPRPEYRLLEAISQGGRFNESVPYIYVIRSTPLSDAAAGRHAPTGANPYGATPTGIVPSKSAPSIPDAPIAPPSDKPKQPLIDIIDQIGQPPSKSPGAPGMMPMQPTGDNRNPVPVIDIDGVTRTTTNTVTNTYTTTETAAAASTAGSKWQFVNGQWTSNGAAASANTGTQQNVLSQRVLQIPMSALLAGSPNHNVIIRPGDVIRIPSTNEGIVYVHGNVNRPGVYQLPATSRLTVIRAIAAAGDLNDIGIPERVDITRFLGEGRQATVRLNYRAIAEGTQPDVYLRDGDVINVGTNFWATPLAVIRNGFRATYGFGFTLDRNFGYDVFGPQKTNQTF